MLRKKSKENEQPIAIRAKMFKEIYYDKFLNEFDFVKFNKLLTDYFMKQRHSLYVIFNFTEMGKDIVRTGAYNEIYVYGRYEKELRRYLEERGFKIYVYSSEKISVSFD